MVLQQQSMVLSQIAEKLDVSVQQPGGLGAAGLHQPRMSILPPSSDLYSSSAAGTGSGAGPDSLQVGAARRGSGIMEPRPYRRSVRITVDRSERPPSTAL